MWEGMLASLRPNVILMCRGWRGGHKNWLNNQSVGMAKCIKTILPTSCIWRHMVASQSCIGWQCASPMQNKKNGVQEIKQSTWKVQSV